MTYSEALALLNDSTRPAGVLYHTLAESTRTALRACIRPRIVAHATGNVDAAGELDADILALVRKVK